MEHECECEALGFCLKYNKKMTKRERQICRGEVLTPEKCQKYRELWLRERPTLAGDIVDAIASVTGVKAVTKLVEKVTGKSCGCAGRRKRMNENHAKRKDQ